jgi:hypothetical protein
VKLEDVARVCYEANRAYRLALNDDSQKPWDEAEQWQRDTNITGVKFRRDNPDVGPIEMHNSWMRAKIADGWTLGDKIDGEAKTHPNLRPYTELDGDEQAKDKLFAGICDALLPQVMTE